MENVYFYLKSFTDPVAIILLLMGTGLWILKDLRKERSKRVGWWILLVCFFMLYFLSIKPVVSSFAYILERDYLLQDIDKASEVDVLVVLGGGISWRGLQSKYGPSGETSSRLLFGLQALKQSNAKFIVLAGRGRKDISEAEVMAGIAKRLGVDESKIIVESKSENTWEQAVELDKLLKNKEMTIGIVTSALHMKRSIKVFSKFFKNIVPLPSSYLYSPGSLSVKSFLPNSRRFYMSSAIIHEIIGLCWYNIRR